MQIHQHPCDETAIFQWVWLEQASERGIIPAEVDQFNSLHEKLVDTLGRFGIEGKLHLACAQDSDEDAGTVEYLEDCARQAGLDTGRIFIEEIGLSDDGWFTDLDDRAIATLFKLYPWEWLLREPFAENIPASNCHFIEPAWKSVLSNKGLLPLLWHRFPGHPNLLPAVFEADGPEEGIPEEGIPEPLCPQADLLAGRLECRANRPARNGNGRRRITGAPMATRVISSKRTTRCRHSTGGGRCAASGWWRVRRPACASERIAARSPPTRPLRAAFHFGLNRASHSGHQARRATARRVRRLSQL